MRCESIQCSEACTDWQPPQASNPIDQRERDRRAELRELDEHLLKVARARRESELNGSF